MDFNCFHNISVQFQSCKSFSVGSALRKCIIIEHLCKV